MSGFVNTLQLSYAFLTGDEKGVTRATHNIDKLFVATPVAPTLVLNVLTFNMLLCWFRYMTCSPEFQMWSLYWSLIPSVVGSCAFYTYRYGVAATLLSVSPRTLVEYLSNWCHMASIACYSFCISYAVHVGLLWVEPLLPHMLQGTVYVPQEVLEVSIKHGAYMLYLLGAVLAITLPVWQHGYKINTQLFGRNMKLSNTGMLMEIMYFTCQSGLVIQHTTGLVLLQTHVFGLPFHVVHLVAGILTTLVLQRIVKLKFMWLHKLQHEVKPLYTLCHLEHHLCNSIFPTTSALGLWEAFILGGTPTLNPALYGIPYFVFQSVYCGANIVVHTMWPFEWAAQWHTAHHTVGGDVYSVNIPTEYDKTHSKIYAKHNEALEKISPFVRIPPFSDILALVMSVCCGVVMHYGMGIGLFKIIHTIEVR
eukprot:Hpha_TRINITY_DN15636_c0_g1::TRINITY_DN15636_c0_g1_i3::g.100266::m.100266